jgi:hypothetical protein
MDKEMDAMQLTIIRLQQRLNSSLTNTLPNEDISDTIEDKLPE